MAYDLCVLLLYYFGGSAGFYLDVDAGFGLCYRDAAQGVIGGDSGSDFFGQVVDSRRLLDRLPYSFDR
mgnify:CR=1 FL=1